MTPDEHTNQEIYLDVGDGHKLYVHDWGNVKAKTPILFLHGGPGSHTKDHHKVTFDPSTQRVIFFDQRGSGKSTPTGSLEANTTKEQIGDIEKIADHLALNELTITGGSWGSCLALAYALEHPKRIKAMVLRGIFTASRREFEFIEKGGFKDFFPDVWQNLLKHTPKAHHHNPSEYHYKRILGKNEAEAKESAYYFGNTEAALLNLDDRFTPERFEDYDPAGTIVAVHYYRTLCFLPDRHILDNAHKLKMPIWLIQGRYDMVCPPITAYELNKVLPNSHLVWTTAGHGNERPNYDVNRTILLQMTS